MRVPRSFQPLTETRVSHLELVCNSYTSQGPLKKWTDHCKLAINKSSKAAAPLRVPRLFQPLTEIRVSHLDLVCFS